MPHATPSEPGANQSEGQYFFDRATPTTFVQETDGSLIAVAEIERPPLRKGASPGRSGGQQRLVARFPRNAEGSLAVTVAEQPHVWLREQLVGGSANSKAQVSDGRLVYAAAKRGMDRIYEVTEDRVEEYLRIEDNNAVQATRYEIETGPGISDLTVDGGGCGLVAIDAQGKQVLKAPQPTGVDSQGNVVRGKFVVQRVGANRFAIRLELLEDEGLVKFPVLIDPSWVATGSMASARYDHSATVLPNGKLLVVGGTGVGTLASAELYDKTSNVWTTTAAMSTARTRHTATLLNSGKVLVAGGHPNLSSAELFDPATSTWSAVGPMLTARNTHTATRLNDGRVLVTGGYNTADPISSAEIFDPTTNSWNAVASMNTARRQHTATLLSDGKVLVAGGQNAMGYVSKAEIYDPSNNTWTEVATMPVGRFAHSATLLGNGKILFAGGAVGGSPNADLYDPTTNTWSSAGAMQLGRSSHTATLLNDGNVLVAGGVVGATATASASLYDPWANQWTTIGSMTVARSTQTATLLGNGKVLLAGGFNTSATSSAELFTVPTNIWTTTAAMSTARTRHTATLLNSGKVLVAGGHPNLSSAELFDPATSTWSAVGPMLTARNTHTATRLNDGRVLVTGGYNTADPISSAEIFDPTTNSWNAVASMNTARRQHTATLLSDGKVLVAGGQNAMGYVSKAEIYDPSNNTWTEVATMPVGRFAHSATLLGNGKILFAGGAVGGSPNADLYDPTTNTWSSAGAMQLGRSSHTATLLNDGNVLVAGGSFQADSQLYSPGLNTWGASIPIATNRSSHTATLLPTGKTLAAGGGDSSAELFNQSTQSWETAGSLAVARKEHTATLLGNGKVLVTGGALANNTVLATAELYVTAPANGSGCGTPSDCDSGYCVGEICCDTPCAQACEVCSAAKGSPMDGVCAPAPIGTPSECAPFVCSGSSQCPTSCTSDSQCTSDRYCDSNGNCQPQKVQASVCSSAAGADCFEAGCRVCQTGFCVNGVCCDSACSGACDVCSVSQGATSNGVCSVVNFGAFGTPNCAPYVCDGVHADCPVSCDSSADCSNGFVCSAQHTCASSSLKMLGDQCASAADCQTNFCVDGVCCEAACAETCRACESSQTGESSGLCRPVLSGVTDTGCPSSPPCGADGKCDGAGVCRPYASPSTKCGDTICVGAQVQGLLCDGQGQCANAPPTSCSDGYVCVAGSCPESCQDSTQCDNNHFCEGTICVPKTIDGLGCNDDAQCDSGYCVDGVCCDTACDGICESCDGNFNAEGAGKCSAVNEGDDPRQDCSPTPGNVCASDGTCNGQRECRTVAPQGVACGTKSCDGNVVIAQQCDGFGICAPVTDETCNAYACEPATVTCRTSCVTSVDCANGAVCTDEGTCSLGETICVGISTAQAPDGSLSDCHPGKCELGQCVLDCASKSDCAPDAQCSDGHCVAVAGSGGSGGTDGTSGSGAAKTGGSSSNDGGCSIQSGNNSGINLLILALLAAKVRRRTAA